MPATNPSLRPSLPTANDQPAARVRLSDPVPFQDEQQRMAVTPSMHQQPTCLDLALSIRESIIAILNDALDQLDILDVIAMNKKSASTQSHSATTQKSLNTTSSSRNCSAIRNRNVRSDVSPSRRHSNGHDDTVARERRNLHSLFTITVSELRQGHVGSMIRRVNEEKAKRNQLANSLQREKEAIAHFRELQRSLTEEQRTLECDRKNRDMVITQLREAIQEIQALTTSEQKYLKRATRAHESASRSQYTARELALINVKTRLSQDIIMEEKAHNMLAKYLHERRINLELQIQQWMIRHEEDTEQKISEIEMIKNTRMADVDKYEEIVAKYEDIERLVEEDKANRAKLLEERQTVRAAEIRMVAARRIQRWWRALMLVHHPERATTATSKPSSAKSGKGSAGKKKGNKSASAGKKKGGKSS